MAKSTDWNNHLAESASRRFAAGNADQVADSPMGRFVCRFVGVAADMCERTSERRQDLLCEPMRLLQVAKAQDGSPFGQTGTADIELSEPLKRGDLEERRFLRSIRRAELPPQKVNTRHRIHSRRRPPGLCYRCARRNQHKRGCPRRHPIPPGKRIAARPVARIVNPSATKARLFRARTALLQASIPPAGQSFPDFSPRITTPVVSKTR